MENYDKNIDSFKKLEPDFKKSEADLWAGIEAKMTPEKESKKFRLGWITYAAAASIVLLLSIGIFMRFYTVHIETPRGEQLAYTLPDGSIVQLNAASEISLKPYWWNYQRAVKLNGEAFFKVAKGEKFSVISEEGTTTVMGTQFNIYARNNEYKVYCERGRVKVKSNKYDIHYQIIAGELAIIDNPSKSGSKRAIDARDFISWTENRFSFTNENLARVFEEMERQYNIQISYDQEIGKLKYGAYFEKPSNPKAALDLICIQFHLKFEETAKGEYKIFRN